MTVCVATLFSWNYGGVGKHEPKRAAIVASDRMITAWDSAYEPNQLKVGFFTPQTVILIAGDYALHSEAIAETYKQIHHNPNKTPHNIALNYGQAVQKIKRRQAEDLFLAPLGMNTDTFIAQQKDMDAGFINRLTNQMQEYRGEDVEALIVGSDGDIAHIYTVDTRGMIHCLNDVGFAAIGIGAWHAKSRLMHAKYTNTANFASALMATFAAKKGAEIAPGVGEFTDTYVILKDGHFRLWDHLDKKIHEIYDHYNGQTNELTVQAIAEVQTYIDSPQMIQGQATNEQEGKPRPDPQVDASASQQAAETARGHENSEAGVEDKKDKSPFFFRKKEE